MYINVGHQKTPYLTQDLGYLKYSFGWGGCQIFTFIYNLFWGIFTFSFCLGGIGGG